MNSRFFILRDIYKARTLRLAKESVWILAGQVAAVLGSLALVRVLSAYLEPAEYGQLALGLTIAGLVNQVLMGGVGNGIARYYPIALEKNDLLGYLDTSKKIIGYATLVALIMGVILIAVLAATDQKHWIALAIFVLLFSILNGYSSTLSSLQNAARQRSIVAIHAGLGEWLRVALSIWMILLLGVSSTNIVLGYFFSAFIITVSQLYFLNRLMIRNAMSHHEETRQNWLPQIWSFSWPISAWGVFTWAHFASDRWALYTFTNSDDVGLYAVVYQLGFVSMVLFFAAIGSLVMPILYQRAGDASNAARRDNVHRLVWAFTKGCLLLTLIGFALAWVLHAWIFQWLVGEAYRDASVYLPWMVLAGGIFGSAQILTIKSMSETRSHDLLYAKIGSALIGVLVNFACAWWFGVTGVVFSLLMFSIIFFVWVLLTPYFSRSIRSV